MGNRTITAPGVELREYDRSEYTSNVQQTAVLVTGFAAQGEENTTMQITSKTGLINQFGRPTTEAERYFYTACNEVLNQGGILYATRLPYDNAAAGQYNTVTYKIGGPKAEINWSEDVKEALKDILGYKTGDENLATDNVSADIDDILSVNDKSITNIKYINFETLSTLSDISVDNYLTEEAEVGENSIVIIDKLRGQYAKSSDGKECLGIIPVITTATNALYAQDLIAITSSDTDAYKIFSPVNGEICFTTGLSTNGNVDTSYINPNDLAIPVVDPNVYADSLSRMIAKQFPTIGYVTPDTFEKEHFKKIGVVILKAYVDNSANNLINFEIVESFVGSLGKDDVDPVTQQTTFIDTIVNANSEYVYLFSKVNSATINEASIFATSLQGCASLGFSANSLSKKITKDGIFKNLDIIFERNSDIHEKEIDIVVDAGITNIAAYCGLKGHDGDYNPFTSTGVSDLRGDWISAAQKFDTFCKNIRKDCIFVCDGIRAYCLQGAKKIIRPSKPTNTIDSNIIPMTKQMCGLNSNYTAGYCNWFQVADDTTGKLFWCPPSIQAMGCYIYTDINYNYWDAPAGQRRGVINAIDCAFNPSIRQAGAIYDKGWNYAINYADVGLLLEGQKTMQQKLSAFDRVNVRRMFLRLEREVYNIARTFVYEPNTTYTRQRLHDLVDAKLSYVKAMGGCYDYRIICDESINTPDVIDNNELRIKIGIQPVKTCEFILVEFYALRTNGSWDEMGM